MRKALLTFVAAAFAPLALAQSGASPYVSLNYGESRYDVECQSGFSCDERDKAYKLGLGWQFNRYLASEATYSDLGQANYHGPAGFGAFLHATAYELSGIGTYPLYGVFSALGRLGVAHGTAKYGRDLSGEGTKTALTVGAGLQLDFTKNVAARLQWQRFKFKEIDVDMLGAGLVLYPR